MPVNRMEPFLRAAFRIKALMQCACDDSVAAKGNWGHMSGNEPGNAVDAVMSGIAGDAVLNGLRAEPLLVAKPERQTAPFIFASPHSGRLYPASFARQSRLDPVSLRKSEDAFVDELFANVTALGAPL